MKKIAVRISFFLVLAFIVVQACNKTRLNDKIFDEVTSTNLVFYQGQDSVYNPAGGSPHGDFKLKFNSTAASVLDATGRLPAGSSFPDGSLIVKEALSGTSGMFYAIMKKDKKSKFANEGWLWAEYNQDGTVIYNVKEKGSACISCHSASPNRDHVRSFDLH
ncbi:MAG: cytochrome P460 family protein [Bacteroidota bacterium]|nr:cytochrome P460 family protein [Bacteroidota bacterium]